MTQDPPVQGDSAARAARLSVAPMLDWTDRHCRAFHRVLSRHALLYTEMIVAQALTRGGALHLLAHDPGSGPVAVQLGGSDPAELAAAARLCEAEGFDEVNLNVGCPSDRVQSGAFGAVLMREPALVGDCVAAMAAATRLPVTVKCRIGVDEQDPQTVLPAFVETMRSAGVRRLIIHARKAWLRGLSPRENRDIPPLDYPLVHQIKHAFPDLHVSINGGIDTLGAAQAQIAQGMDGVMIGRAAYHHPAAILLPADPVIFGQPAPLPDARSAAQAMRPHIARHLAAGGRLHQVTRHMLGLFAGQPGARAWRQILSQEGTRPGAGLETFEHALAQVGGLELQP